MIVAIVGAGNVGTQLAVHCASKGHAVRVHSSRPEKFGSELRIVDSRGTEVLRGPIEIATSDMARAVDGADLIFVTVPAFAMERVANDIEPYAREGQTIVLVPGTGGGECAFSGCLSAGSTIFGLQRTLSVARLVEYGKTVRAVGYRDTLYGAALPHGGTDRCCELIESIFDMPCEPLANYLSITMTPSNPILHTTRLRTIFKDWRPGKTYDRLPLFYEGWDDESSELLFACDEEVQGICRSLDMFDLTGVRSLHQHYESDTAAQLTRKIRSIEGFKGIETPSTRLGFVPDFSSRYFTADFPFGLAILVQIADLAGVDVPNMAEVLSWYRGVCDSEVEFSYERYGIQSLPDFVELYSR